VDQYLPIVVMFVLAVGFVVLSLFTSKLLAPARSTLAKEAPYECGIVPTRGPARRFPVRFYLVASEDAIAHLSPAHFEVINPFGTLAFGITGVLKRSRRPLRRS
jgi:hypothetical protein